MRAIRRPASANALLLYIGGKLQFINHLSFKKNQELQPRRQDRNHTYLSERSGRHSESKSPTKNLKRAPADLSSIDDGESKIDGRLDHHEADGIDGLRKKGECCRER